jgi:hypothetical protein
MRISRLRTQWRIQRIPLKFWGFFPEPNSVGHIASVGSQEYTVFFEQGRSQVWQASIV